MTPSCLLVTDTEPSARIRYGIDLVSAALRDAGMPVRRADRTTRTDPAEELQILIGNRSDSKAIAELEAAEVLLYTTGAPGADGYYLEMLPGGLLVITGGNDTGVLYGCQQLASIVADRGAPPRDLDHGETPEMELRGPAIGLQKTTVEPPRQTYEYPITPDRFGWFYDRELWLDVLDRLFEQRANVIYLWSGHPFSSFVRLDDYPEAQEVTDDELELNRDTLSWLTREADRRGIWVVIKFYNIHIPLPFAEHHQIPLRQPQPTPLTAGYTRAAIAAFVADFPNIGLYICLGEVLQGDLYGREWFVDTILAGLNDGLQTAGISEPPPVILRGHTIDPEPIVSAARAVYPHLFTEAKYNGESLTTWNPRGPWQDQHRFLASLDSVHIANVHILANLEPFRFGAVSFIRRSVQAMRHRLGANGLHLYPLFYWDWPVSPDRAAPRLRQLDRDWIWYEAWHRYAWKADRDPEAEEGYWVARLTDRYGSAEAGRAAYQTYEAMGQIAPRLLRRLGITEGNRQTFSLGMTMSQLINPQAHRPWPDLWESHAPGGERLEDYVRRELAGEPHRGETPVDVIDDARHFARLAVDAAEQGADRATRETDDFVRFADDARALAELADFYALRVRAAIEIIGYRRLGPDATDDHLRQLRRARDLIADSVRAYRRLTEIAAGRYHHANSMQTPQRRVPFTDGSRYGNWTQCLPEYEAELRHLSAHIDRLAENPGPSSGSETDAATVERWPEASMISDTAGVERFDLSEGATVFTDSRNRIWRVAPEIDGMRGLRISRAGASGSQVTLQIELPEPARVLVGYFRGDGPEWLQVPDLETDTHADERGGLDPVLRNAIGAHDVPPVDIHAFGYPAGRHTLALGRGAYLIAGAVPLGHTLVARDTDAGREPDSLDWLFTAPE